MRPEILFPLFAPVSSLKGVGPKLEPLVERAAGRVALVFKPRCLVCQGKILTVRRARKAGSSP